MKQREIEIEIKVRAWNKKEKRMYQITTLAFLEGQRHFGYDIKTGESAWLDAKDVILLQYTGLKDKNGKRIYNGNIVKATKTFQGNVPSFPIIGRVVWEEDRFWRVIWNPNPEEKYEADIGLGKAWEWMELEVIGNIYENPELLKTNK